MFKKNKYYVWYYNIINTAQSRTLDRSIYTERHHIIPRSLNGSNHISNLATLTAKEHFICHLLLVKFTTGRAHYQMKNAVAKFMQSTKHQKRILTAKQYEKCRIYVAVAARYFRTGSTRTKESIQKAIQTNILRYGAGSSRVNAVISEQQKQKMRDKRKIRDTYQSWFINADPIVVCENHKVWAKKHSNFVHNNPSNTEEGKRAISLAKSPGTLVTPYGTFKCRYDFNQHSVCKAIGYATIYQMQNKLDNIIKTRAINRANLPPEWKNKTWRQVGFDLLTN